jgi:UDP-glucose 4-epimerase
MKVVVTGGAGFIGANLCRKLRATDGIDEIVALDDLSTGLKANLDGVPDVDLLVGSILDTDALDEACRGAGAVVHLAARPSVPRSLDDPMASHDANATGTAQVLEAARRAGNAHVVVASSSSVYGANPTLPKHEDLTPAPVSPYAASKLATESYALAWARSFGLPVLAFRFFNVFGPLQAANHAYAAVVPAFVAAGLEGVPLTVHGDGTQSRDFTYVGSVTSIISDALTQRITYDGPVNLAFGGRATLLELIALIEAELGHPVERAHTEVRKGDVPHSQAEPTRLNSLFPGTRPTPLVDGLRATVGWFRDPDSWASTGAPA